VYNDPMNSHPTATAIHYQPVQFELLALSILIMMEDDLATPDTQALPSGVTVGHWSRNDQ